MSYTHFRRAVSRPAYLALALSALLSFSGIVRADAPANQPPTIALIGAENFVIGVGSTFNDPGVTANDPDGDIVTVSSTTAPSAIDTSAVGTFMITYTATDPGGLTAIAMRQVIVSGSSNSDGGGHSSPTPTGPLTIIADVIVCDNESDLPNWGDKGPAVTPSTAAFYVTAHPACHLTPAWDVQWGYGFGGGNPNGAKDPGPAYTGPGGGSGLAEWHTFGPTDAGGMAMASIPDLHGAQDIWFRENLKPGYVPFSEPPMNPVGQKNSVSAEAYCASDVLNYDNYDAIYGAQLNTTYYCIAFNSIIGGTPTTTPANTPPTIALTGSSTMTITVGDAFVDLGATATDTEDGDLTSHVITTGSVNTSSAGTYVLTYTVTDSGGLSTSTTRTVIVQTSGDGGPSTNTPPVITILGDNPLTININTDFVDPGATSSDAEDGDLTANIIASSTVSTTTVGTYTVTYTVTDSAGATTTATRTVNVVDNTDTGCVTDCGGGGGGGSGTNGGPNLGTGGGGGGSPFFASSFGSGATINGPLTCPLLNSYLRYGDNNDPTEVLKLQAFLQRNQGLDVDVTGTFDLKTLAGVNAFQTKYLGEVMGPWDATRSSGYVYITTKKKVNEIACATAFIINPAEQAIIDAYKAAQNGTGPLGPQNTSTTSPDIGFNATSSNVASGDFFNNPNTAGVANASILARFWAFLKSLFGFGS